MLAKNAVVILISVTTVPGAQTSTSAARTINRQLAAAVLDGCEPVLAELDDEDDVLVGVVVFSVEPELSVLLPESDVSPFLPESDFWPFLVEPLEELAVESRLSVR